MAGHRVPAGRCRHAARLSGGAIFSLLLVAVVIIANLLADIAYGMADPRIGSA